MIRMVGSSMKGESGPSKVVGYSKDDQDCYETNDLGAFDVSPGEGTRRPAISVVELDGYESVLIRPWRRMP